MKDGSMVYGRIVEKSKDRFLIKTVEGFRFGFTPDQVERYVSRNSPKEVIHGPEGLGFTIQSGMLIGSGNDVIFLLPSFTPMLTYTINKFHSISVGTGVEIHDDLMLPVFADYKINFSKNRLTPFYYLKGGVLFYLESDKKGDYWNIDYRPGYTFGTGMGLSWPFSKYDSYIMLGYRYSFTKHIEQSPPNPAFSDIHKINRLDITFGFKF
ncbi:MAG: hypothetical protein NT092_12385 [Bacteroidia bacterium]|nr:hypothetical protein [Bacteroidia bacterium]